MPKIVPFILLLILMKPMQLFASSCIVPLSSQDKRINALSTEAQNMFVMSSLIVSQLQPNVSSINMKVLLLSALTTVKVTSPRKGVFHNFSLIDETLFTVFKNLEILEDVQAFLLSQLGFNNDNLGPFSRRYEGGLILHLDEVPSISMITNFNYNNTINRFLDKIIELEKGKEKTSNEYLTFNELLLLVSPLRPFLFQASHTENRVVIKSLLYELFNNLRQQKTYQQNTHQQKRRSYTQKEKDEIIQQAIALFAQQDNITIAEIIRRLNIDVTEAMLRHWLNRYEEKNGTTPGRKRHRRRSQQNNETN